MQRSAVMCPAGRPPIATASELDGQPDHRAVNDKVDVVYEAAAIGKVDVGRQRPVANVGGERVAAVLPRVAVDGFSLPGEQAAAGKTEAADVGLEECMLAGRKLVAQPESNHGIGPEQVPAVGDADGLAAIELSEAGIGEGDGAGEIEIDLVGNVPEAAARIEVERCEGLLAARPFGNLVQAGRLENRQRDCGGGVGLGALPIQDTVSHRELTA
jgi:hypothetical protein